MIDNNQEEKHKYKRAETIKTSGTLFRRAQVRIVFYCSECGDIKVVDL